MEDLEAYVAWKEEWLARHETLEEAVALAREQGGDAYANRVAQIISEMEAKIR